MELQDRKMKILQAIIRNYLETGEPVGDVFLLMRVTASTWTTCLGRSGSRWNR